MYVFKVLPILTAAFETRNFYFIMRLIITLILLAAASSAFPATQAGEHAEMNKLEKLDKLLERREFYTSARQMLEDSLRAVFDSIPVGVEKAVMAETIGYHFTMVHSDSASGYFRRAMDIARAIGDKSLENRMYAHYLSMCVCNGDMSAALEDFWKIDTTELKPEDRLEFYSAGARLYLGAGVFTPLDRNNTVLSRGLECSRRYLREVETDSVPYNYVDGLIAYFDKRRARSLALESDVIEHSPASSPYNEFAREVVGAIYIEDGEYDKAVEVLTDGVCNDIVNGYRISNSGLLLARALMLSGDFEKADKILDYALQNAISSNDMLRFTKASQLSPSVANMLRESVEKARVWMWICAGLLTAALGLCIWLWLSLRKEKAKIRRIESRVVESKKLSADYFNRFLTMCALYIERLEEFKRLTHRKIKAGKTEELVSMLKSGDMLAEQSDTFNSMFDEAFIQAYPDFVRRVNRLLQPDKQLEQPAPDRLGTDLRLLAFMRIGFDDSAKIAKLMGLSVNTIYAYRNRIRGRAVDRDTFEKLILYL